MSDLHTLERKLGYTFKNIEILKNALTHTSYLNEHKSLETGSNERLEFLGDSVLGLSVSDYLYLTYPEKPEGELSKIRASVVCEEALAVIAARFDLGSYILMGRGELLARGNLKPSITSDAMESVIAAIYLDSDFETAKGFILKWLKSLITEAAPHGGRETDYKTILQEFAQAQGHVPEYAIISESGPDHSKVFETKVNVGNGICIIGKGSSKKKAEQAAAKNALQKLNVEY